MQELVRFQTQYGSELRSNKTNWAKFHIWVRAWTV